MKPKYKSRTLWINGVMVVFGACCGTVQIITPLFSPNVAAGITFVAGILLAGINFYLKNQDYDNAKQTITNEKPATSNKTKNSRTSKR